MNMMSEDQLMARAAWLYYVGGLNQEATSKRMGLTRARVNKLLSQARDTGLVSISINQRELGLLAEEEAIRTAFGLEFCISTPPLGLPTTADQAPNKVVFNMVGAATAQYLRDQLSLHPKAIIGTGWGRTLESTSRNMSGVSAPKAKFVSLMGSLTSNSSFNPFEVVHALSQATGADGYFLPAPFIADTEEDRDVFLSQRSIEATMNLAQRADLAIVSVGELTENSLLRRQKMISAEEMTSLRAAGAVADTNGIYFDANGKTLEHDLNQRAVAVKLILLARTRTVLLSAGLHKLEASMAVLKNGFVKGLIIDGDSAIQLAKMVK